MSESLRLWVSEQRRLLGNPYAYMEYLDASNNEEIHMSGAAVSTDIQIREDRKLLQNQYAHLNGEGGFSAKINIVSEELKVDALISIDTRISASRKFYGNRYAYLDGDDGFSAKADVGVVNSTPYQLPPSVLDSIIPKISTIDSDQYHYSDSQIEQIVRRLQIAILDNRELLWNGNVPNDPVDLLDARVALQLIGYKLISEATLGQYEIDSGNADVAGLIDRSSRSVHISQMFPPNVQSFTMAHELGHAVLHSAGAGIHRDRPFNGEKISRNPTEYEADKFATYFRMPSKLVKNRFAKYFCTTRFQLNEDTAFALNIPLSDVKAKCPSRRHLARLLAGTEFYNQNHFDSLSSQFNVSIEAMAIRLEELDLIDF